MPRMGAVSNDRQRGRRGFGGKQRFAGKRGSPQPYSAAVTAECAHTGGASRTKGQTRFSLILAFLPTRSRR